MGWDGRRRERADTAPSGAVRARKDAGLRTRRDSGHAGAAQLPAHGPLGDTDAVPVIQDRGDLRRADPGGGLGVGLPGEQVHGTHRRPTDSTFKRQ
jgi:hypothetical protein